MTISALGTQGSVPLQRPDHPRPPKGPPEAAMAPTAKLLGLSTDELKAKLDEDGTTLASLAGDQGVSRQDLLASIEEGLKASPPPGADAATDLSALATAIADGKSPKRPGGPGGPPPARDPATSVFDAASLAGLDPTTFAQQLTSGTADLTKLLRGSGISTATLASTLGGLRVDLYA